MILNLARKWRSRTFNELIGQDLSVMILKNTLYLGHFFPVYLFSGQRGCGKTTTARIFATALNCSKLEAFQKDPKQESLPCLQCTSCVAFAQGNHPDFIEIDAASHTGVDNVRQIVEAASLLPILGRKRIYLIDEAHMLSKAAFNAFLKILEEPPATVLFILATTDPQKIIETVRSRCFQLFFRAVGSQVLLDHLSMVCQQENILAQPQGLMSLVNASQGSVRDALNLLEQVRFAASVVDQQAVLKVLGYCDDEKIIALLGYCINQQPQQLLAYMRQNQLEQYDVIYMWQRLIDLCHELIATKCAIPAVAFVQHEQLIFGLSQQVELSFIKYCLHMLYQHELQFQKTAMPYKFFMMILLECAGLRNGLSGSKHSEVPVLIGPAAHDPIVEERSAPELVEPHPVCSDAASSSIQPEQAQLSAWQQFLQEIPQLSDPLVESIFKQALCKELDLEQGKIVLQFAAEFSFFEDMLNKAAYAWQPLLEKIVGVPLACTYEFSGTKMPLAAEQKKTEKTIEKAVHENVSASPVQKKFEAKKPEFAAKKFAQKAERRYKKSEVVADVADKNKWPIANMLLSLFPGKISYLEESYNE